GVGRQPLNKAVDGRSASSEARCGQLQQLMSSAQTPRRGSVVGPIRESSEQQCCAEVPGEYDPPRVSANLRMISIDKLDWTPAERTNASVTWLPFRSYQFDSPEGAAFREAYRSGAATAVNFRVRRRRDLKVEIPTSAKGREKWNTPFLVGMNAAMKAE